MIYEPQETSGRPGRSGRERELAAAIVGMAIVGALIFQFSCRGVSAGPARWLCPNTDRMTSSDSAEVDEADPKSIGNEESDTDDSDGLTEGQIDAPGADSTETDPDDVPSFFRPEPTAMQIPTTRSPPFGGGNDQFGTSEPGEGFPLPTAALPREPGNLTGRDTDTPPATRSTGYPGGTPTRTPSPTPTDSAYPGP